MCMSNHAFVPLGLRVNNSTLITMAIGSGLVSRECLSEDLFGGGAQQCPKKKSWKNVIKNKRSIFIWNCWRIWDVYLNIHWASKETYNFLEWCPLKSTASKWMIFGLMLATVQSSSLPTSKNKEIECGKNEINAFKSQQVQFKNHRTCSLSTVQTFEHFNSYSFKFNSGVRNHVHNTFALQQTYCERIPLLNLNE